MASTAGQRRAKQRDATDRGPTLTVVVDGKKYTWTAQDMTALDVRALREATGMSYNRLVQLAKKDMDVDLLAAVVWMARRVAGERDLTYLEVAESTNWTEDYFITDNPDHPKAAAIDNPDGGDHPEA